MKKVLTLSILTITLLFSTSNLVSQDKNKPKPKTKSSVYVPKNANRQVVPVPAPTDPMNKRRRGVPDMTTFNPHPKKKINR